MELITAQIEWCNYRINSVRVDRIIQTRPEPNYPHGRKAKGMSDYWIEVRTHGAPGVLWLDPDVALDPDDMEAMAAAVELKPADMHTGLLKLWPESTGLDHWIWSHRGGTLGYPVASQKESAPVAYVALGCLWTPARLLDLVFPRIEAAQWADVDVELSECALKAAIPAWTVPGCRPKHLHFTREHDGRSILDRHAAGLAGSQLAAELAQDRPGGDHRP